MSYTGRKVIQVTSYDVNTDPEGNETWEIEEAVTVSPKELEIIKFAVEHFRDATEQCIQDYLGIHGHREQIVEMLTQLETIHNLSNKLNLEINKY